MRPVAWDLRRLSPRREIRYALLAAMETCWVYAILAFLALVSGSYALSPLSLFAAYWIALLAGRTLPRLKQRWATLQFAAIGIAFLTVLVLVRVELYPSYGLFDFAWLPRYLMSAISFARGFSPELLATLGVMYVFIRGLGFGQRPLTLWFVGFQFRLGIVAFFGLFFIGAFIHPFDASRWIFVYFSLSLLAIALARIDEIGTSIPLGARWTINLLAAVAIVIFFGLAVLQFFTLEAADAVVRLLTPLGAFIGALFLIILIPLGILAVWLIDFIRQLFAGLKDLNQILNNLFPQGTQEALQKMQPDPAILNLLAPILKLLGMVAIVVGLGYLLARALNKRMKQIEEETFIRESIGGDEEDARVRNRRAKRVQGRRRASISAESIRRIYAALVARAADAGLPRHVAETPYEFLPRLERTWPAETEQIRAITDAYVAVHYAERDVGKEAVSRVRAAWQEVEKRIKRKA